MLRPADCAKRARVSLSLIYAWIKEGRLRALRMGRQGSKRGALRIEPTEFEDFLKTMKVGVPPGDDGELKFIR